MTTDLQKHFADIININDDEAIGSPIREMARALKLVAPSLHDHLGMATAVTMIMRKRGFEFMRLK